MVYNLEVEALNCLNIIMVCRANRFTNPSLFSESIVYVDGSLVADSDLDLGALSPLFGLYLLGGLAFLLGQDVEGGVQLLTRVFVVVHAQLVVVGGGVLPLAVRLHVEHLHEGADLHLGVVLAQRLLAS